MRPKSGNSPFAWNRMIDEWILHMNGPTRLTILRICLIPLIMIFNYLDQPWNSWASLVVFLAASITDWLDGSLARKHNLVTTFGKLLDPLADKLLVLTAYLVLLERQLPYIDAWVIILMIGREMGITGLRAFLAAERIALSASNLGKWKMTLQIVSLSFLFVAGEHELFLLSGIVTMYIALVFSLTSAYFYISHFWNLLGEKIMAEQQARGKRADDPNF